jgi:putative transposase
VLLRREGWVVNRKRVRRLYRLDGLQLRMRVRRRKHMALHRGPAPVPTGPTERWSMDFVHDALADGRPFRILTVVDQWSRSSPVPEVASRMSGYAVGEALDRVLEAAPRPRSITVDHGTEFQSRALEKLGVSPRRTTRLHPPRQAHRKRVHRVVQWAAPGRVPERAPVRVDR